MIPTDRAADEAMQSSLVGWSSLVLIPGMLFVFGLIYIVSPRHIPPPQSWANGTYNNACCKPLVLRDGTLKFADKTTRYVVDEGKFGKQINVAAGIGVRGTRVEFSSTFVFVHFNNDSMARPATGEAKSIHIVGLDDSADHVFVKQAGS
ncbi:hypothetical protein [Sphingomonas sp. PAMC 26621]|uniref:hypothetical protein n=1 Tax=Sphingomonas sp. PAMC 26621 TaxID=1112213 RepID=UPI0002883DC3|nr:hypothetical protein [Sphingomonas sp. PAMC 26621]